MKILLLLIANLLLFILEGTSQIKSAVYHMPAEWEPQAAVWMGWHGTPMRDSVSAEIIKAIYRDEQVKLLYRDDTARYRGNRFLSGLTIDTSQILWIKDSVSFYWLRDSGPIFLVNGRKKLEIADFGWNMFGEPFIFKHPMTERARLIGEIDRRVANNQSLQTIRTDMVTEGGAMEVNGKGVLMAIRETAQQRNPGKSLTEIESEYLRVLGCKKMIWLQKATVQDRYFDGATAGNYFTILGANGHIDEVARFVDTHTILLAGIDRNEKDKNPISKIDYEILEENFEILKNATDIDGTPFKVIRVPSPDLTQIPFISKIVINDSSRKNPNYNFSLLNNGDTAVVVSAVSYMNFLISNKAILIPAYWQEGMSLTEKAKDIQVKNLFLTLYPGRKVIQINPLPINYSGGGGIHCATQQEPVAE